VHGCSDAVDTGIAGAKADFSWDGRYIAFHVPKASRDGYEIQIVDIGRRTVRRLTGLQGSAFFPSWTRDGRLSFRYDGTDYRGFMVATDVLSTPESPLPNEARLAAGPLRWSDVFLDDMPRQRIVMVGVWATWSAHSADALLALQAMSDAPARGRMNVGVLSATDIASRPHDVLRTRAAYGVSVPQVRLRSSSLTASLTANQMPMTLMFVDGTLVGQRLGARSATQLTEWLRDLDVPHQTSALRP
jgi:hypothetical protein